MSNLNSYVIFILIIGPITPISNYFFPGSGKVYLLLSIVAAFLAHTVRKFDYARSYFLIGIAIVSITLMCIQGILRSNILYLGIPAYFLPSFFIASSLNKKTFDLLVKTLSIIALVISIGAVIGFIFCFFLNVRPMWSITMSDGRESYLFLTTLTNAYFSGFNIIRPSGIFDEPGTLSFYLCFVAILREFQHRKSNITITILSFGLITFSLAHTVFYILYLLHKKKWILGSFIFIGVISFMTYIGSSEKMNAINAIFISRMSSDDALNENARSQMFLNAKNALSLSVAFFGTKEDGTFNKKSVDDVHGRMGENPLSPLVYHGLIGSWLFYFTLIILLIFALKNPTNAFLYIGYFALLLQRPYSLYLGYSLMTAIVLFAESIQKNDQMEFNPYKKFCYN